jgi:hypothetical protein
MGAGTVARGRAAAGLALVVLAAACAETRMSARGAHVPVLVGPVACIGCAAAPPPQPGPVVVRDSASVRTWTGAPGPVNLWAQATVRPSLAGKADRLVGAACRGEARVTRLTARAFGVGALVYFDYLVQIDVEAVPSSLPREQCPVLVEGR